jgi:NADPH2:quinone reductase
MNFQALILNAPNQLSVITKQPVASGSRNLSLIASQISPLDQQIAMGLFPLTSHKPITLGTSGVASSDNGTNYFIFAEGVGGGFRIDGVHQEKFEFSQEVLFEIPSGIDLIQISALMISQLTAYSMLSTLDDRQRNGIVLILGANGSLGRASILVAKNLGLRIIPVTRSGETVMGIKSLKYEEIKGCAKGLFGAGPSIIIDPIGGEISQLAISVAAPKCHHILVGNSGGIEVRIQAPYIIGNEHEFVGFNLLTQPLDLLRKHFLKSCEDIRMGRINANIGQVFRIRDGVEAYEVAKSMKARIILTS